jgi:serine/threonine-protein kinase
MAGNVKQIGKYEVVETLGKGGMGVVYKAIDPRIGRTVAIKMMTGTFADNPDLLQRFYREAQSTGMLHHANIVIVHDLGDVDGTPYLVMEYLDGEALDKMISARRKLSLVAKLDIIIQMLEGLHYAHERNIVHRDVKPANIMVLKDGAVKIVDFGIARLGDASLTRTGQVVGTVNYMSPEQINSRVVDRRSDVFSAAVVLYELLTYTLPFSSNDTAGTLLKIVNEPAPPLGDLGEDTDELNELIQRGLAKDRDERYQTAEDFAFDLSRVQDKLKRQLLDEQILAAREHMQRQELPKAKELLQQVLRLESHHREAKELLVEVQKLLQQQHRNEQVRQLRFHAEEAFSREAFAEALNSLEQAISLDKSNPELQNLREMMEGAKRRKEEAEEALRKAESAHQAGKLESAVQILEQALQRDPTHTGIKTLHAALSNELQEHQHQQKVQGLLDQARQEISMRHFSQAVDILAEAQKLDANSPELSTLLTLANSGREQEQKRRELQKATTEIEEALGADDYARASSLAEAALQKFAADPSLLKLKALAEKQRDASDRKRFVEEHSAAARKLLDEGSPEEALKKLEEASRKMPGDSRLESLRAIVRDAVERQAFDAKKSKVIQEAKEAIRRKDYGSAVKSLEAAHAELEGVAEITDLLAFAREEMAQDAHRKQVDEAVEEGQRFMREGDYEQAIALLKSKSEQLGDEELALLLAQAQRQVEQLTRKIESAIARSRRLLESRNFNEAVELLESSPKEYARSSEFVAALEKARAEQEKARALASALESARASLERGDFDAASQIVESCKSSYGEAPEIAKAITEIETKRASVAKTVLERAVRNARTLLLARQYAGVRKTLDEVTPWLPFASAELKSQIEALKKDAAGGLERQKKETDLDSKVSSTPSKTATLGSYDASAAGQTVLSPSMDAAAGVAPARLGTAVAQIQQPSRTKPIVIGVAAVILAIAAFFGYRMMSAPPVASTYIQVNAVPWGTVKYLELVKNGKRIDVNEPTPVRIAVPPGEYKIVIAGPDGTERTDQVEATNDQPGRSIKTVFEQIDVGQIVNSH